GSVAEAVVRTFGDLAQDAAHDLAGPGLWKRGREVNLVGSGEGANVVAHLLDQFLADRVIALFADIERHERVDRLAFDLVRVADDRGFRDLRMRDERRSDFGGTDAMAGRVHDVAHPAGDPVIPVLVPAAAVAGEIESGISLEIG